MTPSPKKGYLTLELEKNGHELPLGKPRSIIQLILSVLPQQVAGN
jgi:hypothetical protein